MNEVLFELHGQLRRLAGVSELRLPIAAAQTVEQVLQQLADAHPELATTLARCACAIGDRLVLRRDILSGGERIALLPPVAGG